MLKFDVDSESGNFGFVRNSSIIDYGSISAQTGLNPIVLENVKLTPKGYRPNPESYTSPKNIDAQLSKFDQGAIKFTSKSSVQSYGTAGNSEAFVMPKSEFNSLVEKSGGDLSLIERKLGLKSGHLSDSNTMIVHIKAKDMVGLQVPSGNETGANGYWVPGGYTSAGITEAILDLSNSPFTEIKLQ